MNNTLELSLKNEKLLNNIQVRQKSLHKLSEYLSELESQLALIFASSPDIIVFLDNEARIIKISDAAFPILGYKRDDLIGKVLWDYIAPEDVEDTKSYFTKAQKDKFLYGHKNSFVNHWLNKEGEYTKLVWRFSVCDERDQHIIGIASDVSEFGSNEKYNYKLLEKVVQLSKDGVGILDGQSPEFLFVYANKAFEEISGFAKQEIVDKPCWFNQTEENEQSRAIKTLFSCLQEKKSCNVLLQFQKKNGEIFYGHVILSPVAERGIVVNYILMLRDVTEEIGNRYDWSPNSQSGFTIKISKNK